MQMQTTNSGEVQPYLKPFASAATRSGGESVEEDAAQVNCLLESTPRQLAARSPAIPPPEVLLQSSHKASPTDLADQTYPAGRTQLAYLIVDLQDPTGTGHTNIITGMLCLLFI